MSSSTTIVDADTRTALSCVLEPGIALVRACSRHLDSLESLQFTLNALRVLQQPFLNVGFHGPECRTLETLVAQTVDALVKDQVYSSSRYIQSALTHH